MTSADVIIIGAGHNGLVAANYLAKAGLRVVVVERSDRIGGACVTDEIAPGFKVSAAAYVSGLFRPQIIEEHALAFRKAAEHADELLAAPKQRELARA